MDSGTIIPGWIQIVPKLCLMNRMQHEAYEALPATSQLISSYSFRNQLMLLVAYQTYEHNPRGNANSKK